MSVDEGNMRSLRLRPNEYAMWKELMGHSTCCMYNLSEPMTMAEWPESLLEYVGNTCREFGACGEVIAQCVADWVSGRAFKKEPA